MIKKRRSNKNLFILFFILPLTPLFLTCRRINTQSTRLEINTPTFNGANYSSNYTSFAAIQIPIKITNNGGFNYQGALNAGSNNIQIPTGNIHIKTGYLAIGLNAAKPDPCSNSGSNSNGSTDDILYTEFESDFNIDSSTSAISISYPNPFTLIKFDHFGFKITNPSGGQAVNAKVNYLDIISGLTSSPP